MRKPTVIKIIIFFIYLLHLFNFPVTMRKKKYILWRNYLVSSSTVCAAPCMTELNAWIHTQISEGRLTSEFMMCLGRKMDLRSKEIILFMWDSAQCITWCSSPPNHAFKPSQQNLHQGLLGKMSLFQELVRARETFLLYHFSNSL